MTHNLLDSARSYHNDLIAFLSDMVQIPSVNGRDPEQALAERIIAEAEKLGFESERVALEPDRPNAVVRWGNGPKGFAIIGHMDTVAEGDHALWTYPPFSAQIADGKMFGRGTADNKAGIACGLYTLALLRDSNLFDPDEVTLIAAGVADEENGASSHLGVRYLIDQGKLPVQGAIYAYASHIICVGHRGLIRLNLHAKGKSIHSGIREWANREDGVNAVTGLAEILLKLETITIPAPEHPAFEGLGCTVTPGTLFSGGEFQSMVPASASALVDVRLMPGQEPESVFRAVDAVIEEVCHNRPGLSVEVEVKNNLPGAAIPIDHPLATIADKHAEAISGRKWLVAGAGPANEGYMLIGAGIPTLCAFGPEGGNPHQPDEWVSVENLHQTVAMFAGIIQEYLEQLP